MRFRRFFGLFATSICALSLAGCSGDDGEQAAPASWTEKGPAAVGDGCNPLAPEWDCLLPYPCDFFLAPASTTSGFRVQIPKSARPVTSDGEAFDPTVRFPLDGFPVSQQIAVRIKGGVSDSNLVFHDGAIDTTLTAQSPTQLIEAATGQRIPHFAEVDPRPEKVEDRALVIRPLKRLEAGRRYVVVLQKLAHPDGSAVNAPLGFSALRDGGHAPGVTDRLRRYYDAWVWPALDKAGIAKAQVQLAWDFTTAFRSSPHEDLSRMLALVRGSTALTKPKITITDLDTGPKDGGPWKLEGTIELPWFLDTTDAAGQLLRDESGKVAARKTLHPVRFTAYVPKSAFSKAGPPTAPRVIVAGHGFFADAKELHRDDYLELFEQLGAIAVGVDWLGLSKADVNHVLGKLIEDLGAAMKLVDRLQQALANATALVELARGPHLKQLAGNPSASLVPIGAKATPYYYGASLGHMLGSTLVGLNPAIDRSVLQVGGANFGLVMARSQPFGGLLALVDSRMPSMLGSLKVMLLLQVPLSRVEPLLVAREVVAQGPAQTPSSMNEARPVLMQVGIGDASVPTLAAQLHARALGLGLDEPGPRKVWGLQPFDASKHNGMYVEVDMGVKEPAHQAIPPTGPNEVHEGIRRLKAIRAQIDAFLRPDGQLSHTCSGPCSKGQ